MPAFERTFERLAAGVARTLMALALLLSVVALTVLASGLLH